MDMMGALNASLCSESVEPVCMKTWDTWCPCNNPGSCLSPKVTQVVDTLLYAVSQEEEAAGE